MICGHVPLKHHSRSPRRVARRSTRPPRRARFPIGGLLVCLALAGLLPSGCALPRRAPSAPEPALAGDVTLFDWPETVRTVPLHVTKRLAAALATLPADPPPGKRPSDAQAPVLPGVWTAEDHFAAFAVVRRQGVSVFLPLSLLAAPAVAELTLRDGDEIGRVPRAAFAPELPQTAAASPPVLRVRTLQDVQNVVLNEPGVHVSDLHFECVWTAQPPAFSADASQPLPVGSLDTLVLLRRTRLGDSLLIVPARAVLQQRFGLSPTALHELLEDLPVAHGDLIVWANFDGLLRGL